jgi:hypothetical protein
MLAAASADDPKIERANAGCPFLFNLAEQRLKPGVNFINVLHTAFTHTDPECAKKTVKSAVSFGAFGTYKRKSST